MTSKASDPQPRDLAPPTEHPDVVHPAPPELPRHHQRFDKIPAGFVRFRGKHAPYPANARVEMVIRTAEGFGIAGPRKVHPEEWTVPASELGSIAAARLVPE